MLHPEAFICGGHLGDRIRTGGFHVVVPTHVVLVHHHGVAKRETGAAGMAPWAEFTVGSLRELDVFVRHANPSCYPVLA